MGRLCTLLSAESEIIERRAKGETVRAIAQDLSVPKSTVGDLSQRHQSRIDAMREQLREIMGGMVLGRARTWMRARIKNWCDPKSRTAGPEMTAVFRALEMGTGAANIHVGDVNVGDVEINVDARQIALVSQDPEETARKLAELRGDLLG